MSFSRWEEYADNIGFCLDCAFFEGGNNYSSGETRLAYDLWSKSAESLLKIINKKNAIIPKRMNLSCQDIACLMYHCGGDDEATEIEDMYSEGVLWVGEVEDDDGNKTYGLNIATADYPEEGSTPLVEFEKFGQCHD